MGDDRKSASGSTGPAERPLPYEQGSESQLLCATHIAAIEVVTIVETPWTSGDDGAEHRRLVMTFKLLEVHKGDIDLAENGLFGFEAQQHRVDEFIDIEPPDPWSIDPPVPGKRYLVLAASNSTSPGGLLEETACRGMYDIAYASDVRAAMAAERLHGDMIGGNAQQGDPGVAAARAVLAFAHDERANLRDLFALYLWDRVRQTFQPERDQPVAELLSIVVSPDSTPGLRVSLISEFDLALLMLDPEPELYRDVLRAYFVILEQQESSLLHDSLVEVYIFNMIFDDEEKIQISADAVFPDAAERGRLRTLIKGFEGPEAASLSRWLGR